MRSLHVVLALTIASLLYSTAHAAQPMGDGMMGDGHMMGGWMMIACMVFGILVLVALVLSIVALFKYLRGGRSQKH
jgi:uncharacterized membrane protein